MMLHPRGIAIRYGWNHDLARSLACLMQGLEEPPRRSRWHRNHELQVAHDWHVQRGESCPLCLQRRGFRGMAAVSAA